MRSVSRYMQFLPVVEKTLSPSESPEGARRNRPLIVPPETEGATIAPWSITPKAFGRFMCDIFDEWVINDVGERFVQLFDITLAQWYGVQPSLCAFCPTCGDGLVVEHNGDVYMCDHFVYPEYRLGNIGEEHLRDCRKCEYLFACRGECPKHRFATTRRGEKGLNTLCEGYKHFFEYTAPYMQQMRSLLEQGLEAKHIIPWARQRRGFAG